MKATKTPKFLTLQEIFDKSLNGIRAQGKPSMQKAGGLCAYQGEGGTACGVGVLINKRYRRKSFDEGNLTAVGKLVNCNPKFKQALMLSKVDSSRADVCQLLESLQSAHDEASDHGGAFIREYNARMKDLAEYFNLNYTGE